MLAKIDPLAHTFNHREICCNRLILKMVGERGFEPPTPWSRTRCSTRLSHSPNVSRRAAYRLPAGLVFLGGSTRSFKCTRKCPDSPSPTFRREFGMQNARNGAQTGGWVLFFAPTCNMLLRLRRVSGRWEDAFIAFLCTFLTHFA